MSKIKYLIIFSFVFLGGCFAPYERVDEYEDNIETFINEYGFDKDFIMDFVDVDKVTQEVVDADGYGNLLNSYDGDADLAQVDGEDYYVMRVS